MSAGAEPAPDGRVDLRVDGPVAWITLRRPARLNAFAGAMRDQLHDTLAAAGEHPDVRVVVITGAGRAFCAGADVEVMAGLLERDDRDTFEGYVRAGMRVVRRIRALPCPVVAAVNGVAAGAGASLALACDLRLAAEGASLGFTFNRIGLHPDWGATYFLPRLVGLARARELLLSARMVPATEALRIGLVDEVAPDAEFRGAVERLAADLAARAPLALAAVKRSLDASAGDLLDAQLERELRAQLRCFDSDDVREGIAAFQEKRAPIFTAKSRRSREEREGNPI